MNIKDLVSQNNKVYFSYYRQGYFFYCVRSFEDGQLYCFPVPLQDIGTSTLKHEDKALTFMRWIRASIIDGTLVKEEE